MAFDAIITRSAEKDRNAIIEYLLGVLGTRGTAERFLDEFEHVIEIIGQDARTYPLSQEPRLERLGIHKAPFMNYLALYDISDGQARILRLFHQSQDYARLI